MNRTAREAADNVKYSSYRQQLLNELHALPEDARFEFVRELLPLNRIWALRLVNATLRERTYFLQLLSGVLSVDVSESVHWFRAIIPRLGMRRIANYLKQGLNTAPETVVKQAYMLRSFSRSDDRRGKKALERLFTELSNRGYSYESSVRPNSEIPGQYVIDEATVKKREP